jgi:preprotein translocase SecF subunit
MGKRKYGYIFSSSLLIIGIVSLILRGGPRYNVDFTGGTLLQLKFEKNVQIEQIRAAISTAGYGDSEIKHYGAPNEIVIRASIKNEGEELASIIEPVIRKSVPDNPFVEARSEKVGPKVGKELIRDALYAVVSSMVLMLIYIMFRFQFKYGLAAILALFHDSLITIGIFSLLDLEISSQFVAAILTLIGYSINDTIVVFDRVRENLRVRAKDSAGYVAIVNRSINETLSRTIITSLTTLLVVVVLFFFGGEVLRDFSFALIIGIIIGTYSSIWIATALVVEWHLRPAKQN